MQAMAVITFTYSCDQEALSELAMDFASRVKPDVEGLIWKIFLNNREHQRSAGLYLFRDFQSANAYLNGPYVQRLREAPIVSNVTTEAFRTMQEASIRAGASLGQAPA